MRVYAEGDAHTFLQGLCRRRLAQGRRRCPIEHLERAEVLAVIPVLEPVTSEEIVDHRCMLRYGSRLSDWRRDRTSWPAGSASTLLALSTLTRTDDWERAFTDVQILCEESGSRHFALDEDTVDRLLLIQIEYR